ncbi:hypothetical protein B0J11DRAFT_525390 [Dendryphion nanum]|uniref:Uncharacterized protein n=1 Tax=Dendryphion nanum TaxID=256645 RepID=A0A9P9IRN3_9PLEO|nr:hypothetical protein B0J11DRAFT_525390 [Dendryphion nanum]
MRISSVAVLFSGVLVTVVSGVQEEFWTREIGGRFQACFRDGNDWHFCTGALAGSWKEYKNSLSLGDGYYVRFGNTGLAIINSSNGCFKAHCNPEYDEDAGKRICDVVSKKSMAILELLY